MSSLSSSILAIADLQKLNPNGEQIIGFAELNDMVLAKCRQIKALQPQHYFQSTGIVKIDDVPEAEEA